MTTTDMIERSLLVGLWPLALAICLAMQGCPPVTKDATWETLPATPTGYPNLIRTPTPYGWLVVSNGSRGGTYIPDADHTWLAPPKPQKAPPDAEIIEGWKSE